MSSRTRFHNKAVAAWHGYTDHGADHGAHHAAQAICGSCGERERYTRPDPLSVYNERICLGCDEENGR